MLELLKQNKAGLGLEDKEGSKTHGFQYGHQMQLVTPLEREQGKIRASQISHWLEPGIPLGRSQKGPDHPKVSEAQEPSPGHSQERPE